MNTLEERAAYINAMAATAHIEAIGMVAENAQRELRGESMAYTYDDFSNLINRYGIHKNAIVNFLGGQG